MANRYDIQFIRNPHNKAVILDCSFVVDSTNGNAFGVRSLKKSGRIASVYMNTSPAATTATSVFASGVSQIQVSSLTNLVIGMVITDSTTGGNISGGTTITAINPVNSTISLSAVTAGASASSPGDTLSFAGTAALVGNPNPNAGFIVVNLQDNYNTYLGGYSGFVSPPTGSAVSSGLTAGNAYTIASVGASTLAQWQAAGLAASITPAANVSLIAKTTSVAGGGTVFATVAAGIDHIEVVGDANLMNNSLTGSIVGQGQGMQIILACYKNTVLTAPTNNSVIGLNFYMNNSAQGV